MTLTVQSSDVASSQRQTLPGRTSVLRLFASATAVLVATVAVVCAAEGVRRSWNPLPLWDMWKGYLGFYYRLTDGDTSVWWAQFAEHRILLARLFFWADLRLFHGAGVLLVVANLVTAGVTGVTLAVALRVRLRERHALQGAGLGFVQLAATLVTLAFAWMQRSNFVWGFQIQFLLATLLPLLTYLVLGSPPCGTRFRRHLRFALGLLLGTLSIGTMASGLLTPALAVAELGLLRARGRAILAAATVAVVCFVIYLHGYASPADRPSPVHALRTRPAGVGAFLLAYLGGPAYYMTGVAFLAPLAGVVYLVILAMLGRRAVQRCDRVGTAMTVFGMHVVADGMLTAAGRVETGVALTSRYMTPPLVGWGCLLVLAAPWLVRKLRVGAFAVIAESVVVVLLLPQQLLALTVPTPFQDAADQATLAIALGVPDAHGLDITFPTSHLALVLGRRAGDDGLTVLGQPPFRGLHDRIGAPGTPFVTSGCRGTVLRVSDVPRSGYLRVEGVLKAAPSAAAARLLTLVDPHGTVRGFAVPQRSLPGVSSPEVGLVGYVHASRLPDLSVWTGTRPCSLQMSRPAAR